VDFSRPQGNQLSGSFNCKATVTWANCRHNSMAVAFAMARKPHCHAPRRILPPTFDCQQTHNSCHNARAKQQQLLANCMASFVEVGAGKILKDVILSPDSPPLQSQMLIPLQAPRARGTQRIGAFSCKR